MVRPPSAVSARATEGPPAASVFGPSVAEALRRRFERQGVAVQVVETHISWVLLAGQFAYKIKKPVRLGFLDFSRLEARRHFCEEELRLNRRLATFLYLGLRPVHAAATPSVSRLR